MTYSQTLDYMFAQLPMYHRIGAAAYKADIQPTLDFMAHLGHPERKFRTLHVAGTNGKGSVSHFLASILQEAGLHVGLYTSPHLLDFRERIRIDGEMISQEAVVDFIETHRQRIADLGLSFFEMTVGMAFDHFARQQVDVAVVEVGMGGRLDSTNVVLPELSVITNIGLDHTQFLGTTLSAIAREKAGIIKEGVPVVVGETHPDTAPVFTSVAAERQAPIAFADRGWAADLVSEAPDRLVLGLRPLPGSPHADLWPTTLTVESPLAGSYQQKNLVTVAQAVDCLAQRHAFGLTADHVSRGIAHVVSNTHLQGRWQVVGHNPLTICETAHNADGISAMASKLRTLRYERLHLVYGCVNDKDFSSILKFLHQQLSALGAPPVWHFTQPSVPRQKPVDELADAAEALGLHGSRHAHVADAIAAARAASPADLVLVTGSIFLIADALSALAER